MNQHEFSIRRSFCASFTIEAAIIVPMILSVFVVIITLLFYFHDKNVITVISHETVVMGCGKEEIADVELERYFQKRIGRKLLLFSTAVPQAKVEEDKIIITCSARKKALRLRTKMSMNRTEPQRYIRNLRRLKKIGKQIGETK